MHDPSAPSEEPAPWPASSHLSGAVLVATDGSAGSQDALAWAAAEADTRGSVLRILHVVGWPLFTGDPFGAPPVTCLSAATSAGESILELATARAREIAPRVQVVSRLEMDLSPSAGIVRAVGDDALIVLGLGRCGRRPFGRYKYSTAAQVAGQTTCPVAVIGLLDETEGPAAGRVTAVVGSRTGSRRVLDLALCAAERRGVAVTVIRTGERGLAEPARVLDGCAGAALVVLGDEAPRSVRRALFGRVGRSARCSALGPVILVQEEP